MKAFLLALTFVVSAWAAEQQVIKVALYDDKGATGKGIPSVEAIFSKTPDIKLARFKGTDFAAPDGLKGYDLVMFTGGSGSAEADGLTEVGRAQVRDFVRNGGGYVGICAGAYLACSGFEWGIGVLNAKTVSSKWRRGQGEVKIEGSAFGETISNRGIRYANGPIIKPDVRKDLPAFETLLRFQTELAENDTPVGVMVKAPAMVRSTFGLGRVFTSSPHPEQTAGLEPLVEKAVRWVARPKGPTEELWKRLEAMEVDKYWLPGAIVDWQTGLPTGQPIKDAKSKHTHCSQFVAAATERLGMYVLRPPEHGVNLLANAQFNWLASDAGKKAGWVILKDGAAAQQQASEGRLVLATLKNPDPQKSGHIAIVRPGSKGAELLAKEGPDVMQAGGTNALRTPLRKGFGNHKEEYDQIVFYAHAVEFASPPAAAGLQRLKYNNPGLVVDLGVGLWAWPLPMDFNGDGKLDLVVNCPDKPSNGDIELSVVDGVTKVMGPAMEYPDFLKSGLEDGRKLSLSVNIHPNKVRANMWKQVDFDGDGLTDIIVGAGDWTDYGWDNAYNEKGVWTKGPLRGFVYLIRNIGTNEKSKYAKPTKINAGTKPLETFGWPSPSFADFDGDGDLDLICGEFLDGFTYFENIGTRKAPKYAEGRRLTVPPGVTENTRSAAWKAWLDASQLPGAPRALTMDLEMITPVAIDWNKDGKTDLIVGDEDGRVAYIENTGKFTSDRTPLFSPPRYFKQEADDLKFGALATPVGFDWDGDGDMDIISGDSAGYVAFFENLSGPGVAKPKFAAPKLLQADGKTLRIMAGGNGSIQGPAEAKWGYTTLSAADWDGDGLPDLIVNSILGKVVWYKNIGTRKEPKLSAAQPIEVEWEGAQPALAWGWMKPEGKALLTQWRTTPVAVDWNHDGLMDLIILDQEGYLAYFERAMKDGKRVLLSPRRAFCDEDGKPLLLSKGMAGKSGRRKLCVVDWDGDGKADFLLNSSSANFLRQVGERDGKWLFKDMGPLVKENIEGHDVSPSGRRAFLFPAEPTNRR
ncbi:MAG: hypothetical protein EBU04_06855 [Verrucomicrobia bacterium]|nr:hypothetical protein [Verrucomicrobiota bacterium]